MIFWWQPIVPSPLHRVMAWSSHQTLQPAASKNQVEQGHKQCLPLKVIFSSLLYVISLSPSYTLNDLNYELAHSDDLSTSLRYTVHPVFLWRLFSVRFDVFNLPACLFEIKTKITKIQFEFRIAHRTVSPTDSLHFNFLVWWTTAIVYLCFYPPPMRYRHIQTTNALSSAGLATWLCYWSIEGDKMKSGENNYVQL